MKRSAHTTGLVALLFVSMVDRATAQNVGINVDGAVPHASALLDVDAAALPANGKRAMLIPRMTTAERVAIPAPATSLLVYDATTTSFWFHDGTAWVEWADHLNTWKILGNAGLTAGTHFIGTTDITPLSVRVNNVKAGELSYEVTAYGIRSSVADLTDVTEQTTFGYEALPGGAGSPSLDRNTAVGHRAMFPMTSAQFNTAVGSGSMLSGLGLNLNYNTTVGHLAMRDVGTFRSTAFGHRAMETGSEHSNTAAGAQALLTYPDWGGVAIGYQAGMNGGDGVGRGAVRSGSGTGFGVGACASSTEKNNYAFGYNALNNVTTGQKNVAFGYGSLGVITTNTECVAIGANSLLSCTGQHNNAFGFSALDAVTSGSWNTGLGTFAGPTTGALNYTTAVGYNAAPTAHGRIVFGTTLSNNLTGGFGAWQNPSDARFKRDVQADVPGIELIRALRPVTYRLDAPAIERFTGAEARLQRSGDPVALAEHRAGWERVAHDRHTGLLAQEAATALDSLGVCADIVHTPLTEQDHYTIGYAAWVVPLVRTVQQQQERIALLRSANAALITRLEELERTAAARTSTTPVPSP